MRTTTALKLSLRIPPGVVQELERVPPYGANVEFETMNAGPGWQNSEFQPKLGKDIQDASQKNFP